MFTDWMSFKMGMLSRDAQIPQVLGLNTTVPRRKNERLKSEALC